MRRLAPLFAIALVAVAPASVRFRVTYPASALAESFTGRAVVFLSQSRAPRFGPNWFQPEPMLAMDVKNVRPGQEIVVDSASAVVFPRDFSLAKAGTYNVQVVLDRNLGGRAIGESPGNLYSKPILVKFDPKVDQDYTLVADQVAAEPKFTETATVKEFKIKSDLLSKFYGRPTEMKAAVALPRGYADSPSRKYPVLYVIPGFGGNHYEWSGRNDVRGTDRAGEPFIQVLLNPDCPTGHSVFADSANNGPWGKALTTELIPALEKQFRAVGTTDGRFVNGHSSGGWSSLWLQVAYPGVFGAVWSTSPDPVDFRDFQIINLYKDANMFIAPDGSRRPIARFGTQAALFYDSFSDMERPLGRGEQLGSFDGVFSPRGKDGLPVPLWDRITGKIDPKVAEYWKRYDISLTLRTNWKTLGPQLKGKLHVYTGDIDTFYLEGAVRLLVKDMQALGSDAKIEIFPGDHGSVMTPALLNRIDQEMAATWRANRAKSR